MTLELWLNVKSSNCRQIKRRCAAPELRPLFNQLVALCQKTLNKKIYFHQDKSWNLASGQQMRSKALPDLVIATWVVLVTFISDVQTY